MLPRILCDVVLLVCTFAGMQYHPVAGTQGHKRQEKKRNEKTNKKRQDKKDKKARRGRTGQHSTANNTSHGKKFQILSS
jgi:hypothetical protein